MEKNTNELLGILKTCSNEAHFNEVLKMLPEQEQLTLHNYLERLLQEKGLLKSEVIEKSNLDRNYGYQIFQGKKNASRDKLLALAFAMGLTLEECNQMLTLGQANILYSKNNRDAMLIYGFTNKMSLMEINEFLDKHGEAVL